METGQKWGHRAEMDEPGGPGRRKGKPRSNVCRAGMNHGHLPAARAQQAGSAGLSQALVICSFQSGMVAMVALGRVGERWGAENRKERLQRGPGGENGGGAVWGHVSADGLLVPGTASSSIILLSMENKKAYQ